MKKTMIALALFSIAGTAAAKDFEVQADAYKGKEFVKTYKAIVAEGATTEIKDREVTVRSPTEEKRCDKIYRLQPRANH
jgi:hypothetical protein